MSELWTVRSLLEWSTPYLKKYGVDSPRLAAEIMLAETLACKRLDLYLQIDQPLVETELKTYKAMLIRRAKREPIQYILGYQDFYNVRCKVDSRVLIPRPETEFMLELVEKTLHEQDVDNKGTFLDLCTGSGAIACVLSKFCPEADIIASDISPDALEIARENASMNGCNNITFVQSNLFENIPRTKFDLIVSNPPYIAGSELAELQPEVRDFEPHLALDGGEDGLFLIRKLFQQWKNFAHDKSHLFIEFGSDQGQNILSVAKEMEPEAISTIHQDHQELDRILHLHF